MRGAVHNIMVITGPTPGVGKTFLAANFAAVLASTGKRVLLIDSDMRTGHLYRFFGLEYTAGLSEILSSDYTWEQVVQKGVTVNVDVIASGKTPMMPAELLASARFGELLATASPYYDFVLIDTAPVLAVSDALIVARHAGTTINVVRRGVTTLDQIEQTIKEFVQAGLTIPATVFNDLRRRPGRYGYPLRYEMTLQSIGKGYEAAPIDSLR
jgi:tyrosine-protein kinase Etk/Wzc